MQSALGKRSIDRFAVQPPSVETDEEMCQTAQQLKLLTEAKMSCLAEHRLAAQQASMLLPMPEVQIAREAAGA